MVNDTFARVRTHLLLDNPFFGTLAMHLQPVVDMKLKTVRTDGATFRYNPEYLATLTTGQQKFVLATKVLNCALLHPYRMGGRDAGRWNDACSHVVNGILVNSGMEPPTGVEIDQQQPGDGSGAGTDEAEQGDQPGEQGDSPTGDFVAPSNGGTGQGQGDGQADGQAQGVAADDITQPHQMSESDWQLVTAQAERVALSAGTMPGSMAVDLQAARQPTVDWVTETKEFVTNTMPSNQSWTSPNRRFIAAGVYMPGTVRENVGKLAVIVDSSGSTKPFIQRFTDEFRGILSEVEPESVVLIFCDARVQSAEEFMPGDFVAELKVAGFGGTRFQPAFDYIEKEGIDVIGAIYLTDLDNSDAELTAPGYPVLWITPERVRKEGQFGRTVRMQEVK